MKVKYKFENIKNGVLSTGYISIAIVNSIAKIYSTDSDRIRLAITNGGQPVIEKKFSRKQVSK